jgi:hypothetical protein
MTITIKRKDDAKRVKIIGSYGRTTPGIVLSTFINKVPDMIGEIPDKCMYCERNLSVSITYG